MKPLGFSGFSSGADGDAPAEGARVSHVLLAHRDRFLGDYVASVMSAAGLVVQGPFHTRAEVQEAAASMPDVVVIGEVLEDGPASAWTQQVFGPAAPLLFLCDCGGSASMKGEAHWLERPFAAFQVVDEVQQMVLATRHP